MDAVRGQEPIEHACRVLGVSRSGYYAWKNRLESARATENKRLTVEIRAIFRASRGTYGSPRVTAELRARGLTCSEKRVARLMRAAGIRAVRRRRRRVNEAQASLESLHANVLDRDFSPERPNASWTSDITYLPTAEAGVHHQVFFTTATGAASTRVIAIRVYFEEKAWRSR